MSKVILVNGPPGAGKSTTCEILAKSALGTWAYIAQDKVRQNILSGYKSSLDEWNDETQLQWDVSTSILGNMSEIYQANNINVVVECFAPIGRFDQWKEAFKNTDYSVVILYPDVEVAVLRNANRTGESRLTDNQVREYHTWFQDFSDVTGVKFIDTSKLTPEATAKVILDVA